MTFDPTLEARLEAIAGALEDKAGIDPGAVGRDPALAAKLKRIADALPDYTSAIESHDLEDHDDVSALTPSDGDFLRYQLSTTSWIADTAALPDLSDVSISSPAVLPRHVVAYNGSSWENRSLSIFELNDVNEASLPEATLLYRKNLAADWQEIEAKLNSLTDLAVPSPSDNELLQYDAGSSTWKNTSIATALDGSYVRRDGTLELTADWDTGDYEITAKKWLAENTTEGASYATADFGLNITLSANDIGGSVYDGLFVDQDYDVNGNFSTAAIAGVRVDQAIAGSFLGGYRSLIAGQAAWDGTTADALQTANVGLNLAVKGNNSSANIFGAYTKANNAGTAVAYGYQGYGQNTSAGTGLNAVGLLGFADSDNGLHVGVQGQPLNSGTRHFAFYATKGHNHFNDGVTYFYTNTAIQAAATKTHITPGTDDGSVWIEKYLEVDNTAFFDGGAEIAAQQTLTLGVYTDAQRPAAGTAGRIIFNSDDGQLNIDDGTNWTLPDGTTT